MNYKESLNKIQDDMNDAIHEIETIYFDFVNRFNDSLGYEDYLHSFVQMAVEIRNASDDKGFIGLIADLLATAKLLDGCNNK